MKVNRTVRGGWEIEAETSIEQERIEWLIQSIRSHPDQQPTETHRVSDDGITPISAGKWGSENR